SATSVHPNSKSGSVPPNLKSSIPFYGPQFTPPTFLQLEKRHRDIHGIQREEYALGVQLQCKACKENNKQRGDPKSGEDMYCFATTSHLFWEKWEFWKIPR
ncbi:hypothetical protein SERLADRAFT_391054, partial [Serpula lacrymans var. lacrymans S7.9]